MVILGRRRRGVHPRFARGAQDDAVEEVEVIGVAGEEDCEREMFVVIRWRDREMGVPLAQLAAVDVDVDEDTEEAIGDWHYWMNRGYQLC